MNQEGDPDKEFRIKLHVLEDKEETKEEIGEENAEDDDFVSDSYFTFPQAGTGDVNSECVDSMPFLRKSIASP